VKSLRPLHHGTQSIRPLPPQRRAEMAEIERFARERGINKAPEAERDDRLAMRGTAWHNPVRGGRLFTK
jgi:hypothetical protein